MIDLDHLEALDDAAPPAPDLAQVRRRASRIRTRNSLSAAGAGIAVLAVVLGIIAVYPRGTTNEPVVRSNPNTSSGTLPNGLHADLTLDTPTVALGNNIRATVTVRNDTDETMDLIDVGILDCNIGVHQVLLDRSGRTIVDGSHDFSCGPANYESLAPGETRTRPFRMFTGNLDLRAGTYRLTLSDGAGWSMPALPVTITVPPIGIRLEPHQTIGRPGDVIEGTVLFTNRSGRPINYALVGCKGEEEAPWAVWLAKDGQPFRWGRVLPGCINVDPKHLQLPVGESRASFAVALEYPSCTSLGTPSADSPQCADDGSRPEAAPGDYEIVFDPMTAPFDTIAVDPVPIRVVSS